MSEARTRMLSQNQSGIFTSPSSKESIGYSTPMKRASSNNFDSLSSKSLNLNTTENKHKNERLEWSTPKEKAGTVTIALISYNVN